MFRPCLFLIGLLAIGNCAHLPATAYDPETDGYLLLDIHIHDALHDPDNVGYDKTWAREYAVAVQEKRYGDALWARHHIYGNAINGTYPAYKDWTVLDSIEEDAVGYKFYYRAHWKYALSVYAKASKNDTHPEVLDLIKEVDLRSYYRLYKDLRRFGASEPATDNYNSNCVCDVLSDEVIDSVEENKD